MSKSKCVFQPNVISTHILFFFTVKTISFFSLLSKRSLSFFTVKTISFFLYCQNDLYSLKCKSDLLDVFRLKHNIQLIHQVLKHKSLFLTFDHDLHVFLALSRASHVCTNRVGCASDNCHFGIFLNGTIQCSRSVNDTLFS